MISYVAQTLMWSAIALAGGFTAVRAALWVAEKGKD